MVAKTFSWNGTAAPVAEDGKKAPFLVRVGYAWKALRGDFRIVGPVDITHLGSDGYMEGRLRVYLAPSEIKRYFSA